MKTKSMIFGAFALMMCACGESDIPNPPDNNSDQPNNEAPAEQPAEQPGEQPGDQTGMPNFGNVHNIPALKDPNFTNSELGAMQSLEGLGFELSTQAFKEGGNANTSVSPLSAYLALAMLTNGAATYTETNLLELFGTERIGPVNSACKKVLAVANTRANEHGSLELANSVWVADDFKINSSYIDKLGRTFYADAYNYSANRQEATIALINEWCSKRTHNLIPEIFAPGTNLGPVTLINTMYLNQAWDSDFNENFTSRADFYGVTTSQVDMMHHTTYHMYSSTDKWDAVELYLGGRLFSLFVLLPKDDNSYAAACNLDAPQFKAIRNAEKNAFVELHLPKFCVGSNLHMNSILNALGVDTSGMDLSRASSELQLAEIIMTQRNTTTVNEQGVTAAAVTAVRSYGSGEIPNEPVVFNVNRPFVYILTDNTTGAMLMTGYVAQL